MKPAQVKEAQKPDCNDDSNPTGDKDLLPVYTGNQRADDGDSIRAVSKRQIYPSIQPKNIFSAIAARYNLQSESDLDKPEFQGAHDFQRYKRGTSRFLRKGKVVCSQDVPIELIEAHQIFTTADYLRSNLQSIVTAEQHQEIEKILKYEQAAHATFDGALSSEHLRTDVYKLREVRFRNGTLIEGMTEPCLHTTPQSGSFYVQYFSTSAYSWSWLWGHGYLINGGSRKVQELLVQPCTGLTEISQKVIPESKFTHLVEQKRLRIIQPQYAPYFEIMLSQNPQGYPSPYSLANNCHTYVRGIFLGARELREARHASSASSYERNRAIVDEFMASEMRNRADINNDQANQFARIEGLEPNKLSAREVTERANLYELQELQLRALTAQAMPAIQNQIKRAMVFIEQESIRTGLAIEEVKERERLRTGMLYPARRARLEVSQQEYRMAIDTEEKRARERLCHDAERSRLEAAQRDAHSSVNAEERRARERLCQDAERLRLEAAQHDAHSDVNAEERQARESLYRNVNTLNQQRKKPEAPASHRSGATDCWSWTQDLSRCIGVVKQAAIQMSPNTRLSDKQVQYLAEKINQHTKGGKYQEKAEAILDAIGCGKNTRHDGNGGGSADPAKLVSAVSICTGRWKFLTTTGQDIWVERAKASRKLRASIDGKDTNDYEAITQLAIRRLRRICG